MVANALSHKSFIHGMLFNELTSLRAKLEAKNSESSMAMYEVKLALIDRIHEAQQNDLFLMKVKGAIMEEKRADFVLTRDGALIFKFRICILSSAELKKEILT